MQDYLYVVLYHIFLELLSHGLTEPDKDEERLLTAISQLLSSASVPWLIRLAPYATVKCLPSLPAPSLHQLQHESLYPVTGRF